MLVTSVPAADPAACRAVMRTADAVELRLDLGALTAAEVADLVAGATVPVLATHHGPGGSGLLLAAVAAGATWVDLPLEDPDAAVVRAARAHGCRVVRSHHDFAATPDLPTLRAVVAACFDAGADIAKVACTPGSAAEAARLIALLDDPRPVVALGMGPHGVVTRLAGALLRSPLVFVASELAPATAPGQLDAATMRALLARLSTDPAAAGGRTGPGV